jgi:HK97 family phage prohead protease
VSEPLELEYRTASALDVRHPERVIDLIAVPYDEECQVVHRGRYVTETIAPGSFSGVDRGPVNVNRAHDRERPVGRAIRIHPNDPRGLRMELRIAKTLSGDEVLELAADDLLGASVGFAPLPGGEVYSEGGTRRRITRAYVDHVAMTGDRAYDGAKVLAVRYVDRDAAPVERTPTPRLDAILSDRRLNVYR